MKYVIEIRVKIMQDVQIAHTFSSTSLKNNNY